MITYVGLMDLLNHKGMKKTDLLEILSSKTVAKLSKDEYVSAEVIEKICIFLKCQPGDIMTVLETRENENTIMLHEIDYSTPNWKSTTQTGIIREEFNTWRDVTWFE